MSCTMRVSGYGLGHVRVSCVGYDGWGDVSYDDGMGVAMYDDDDDRWCDDGAGGVRVA